MKKVVLYIDGLKTSNCCVKLEKFLNKKEKIKSALVDFKTKTLTITYFDDLTIDGIEEYIHECGYESLGVNIASDSSKMSLFFLIFSGLFVCILLYCSLANYFHFPIFSFLSLKENLEGCAISLFVMALVFLIYGRDILLDGITKIFRGRGNLNSLVTIGILSSFLYSFYNFMLVLNGKSVSSDFTFFEITIIFIYFIKIGQFIEFKNIHRIENEIRQISKTILKRVLVKEDSTTVEKTIYQVKQGDIIVCMPGDRVLLDGVIVEGNSHFDESFVLGESAPVLKQKNSKILAGSINCETEVEYRVESTFHHSSTYLARKMIAELRNQLSHYSNLVDSICLYYLPFMVCFAVIIGIVTFLVNSHLSVAIANSVTFLVVACPCGLVISLPFGSMRSLKYASLKGFLVKSSSCLELAEEIDTVVFDKTGTLTNGFLGVARVNNHSDMSDKELLELLGSIEKHSSHAFARGIIKYLRNEKVNFQMDFVTEDLIGYGVKAKDDHNIYYACNAELLDKLDIINSYQEEERKMKIEGYFVLYLVKNSKVVATIGLKDSVRKEAKKVITSLMNRGINVIMLTGDNEIIANKIAKELGITEIYAGINPIDKNKLIEKFTTEGRHVMMVGDGLNDSLSLTSALIGVTLKNSSDIPISSADVILVHNHLGKILDFLQIGKKTVHNVFENVVISFICSVVLFLSSFGFLPFLPVGSFTIVLGMILSSFFVILNTLRMKQK